MLLLLAQIYCLFLLLWRWMEQTGVCTGIPTQVIATYSLPEKLQYLNKRILQVGCDVTSTVTLVYET